MNDEITKFARETIDRTRIPTIYLLFLAILLIMCTHPKVLININISKWLPDEISTLILIITNLIYNNLVTLLIIIIVLITLIYFLIEYTDVFFGKNKRNNYFEGQIESTNPYTAIGRLLNLSVYMCTYGWVAYLLINMLLTNNQFPFIITDFLSEPSENSFLSDMNTLFMKFLFIVNIFTLIFFIYNSLFTIKTNKKVNLIIEKDLKLNFIIVNRTSDNQYLFVKSKFQEEPWFYLIEKSDDFNDSASTKGLYTVLNRSQSVEEIHTHFDIIEKNYTT